jgi:hypothetical protein
MIYIRERGYPQRAAAARVPGSWPTPGQCELEGDLWLPSSVAATRVIHVGSAAVKPGLTVTAYGRPVGVEAISVHSMPRILHPCSRPGSLTSGEGDDASMYVGVCQRGS